MSDQPRAVAKISFAARQVYLSSFPGKAGARVLEPIARRLANYLDEVDFHGNGNATTAELRQKLHDATDFVLLMDDHVCEALRKSDVNRLDELTHEQLQGLELLRVLRLNEERAAEQAPQARLWLAKAETIKLLALRKVGGRSDWNFVDLEARQLLHWLYPENEKVLEKQDRPDDNLFVGADETRLGERAEAFYDHQADGCHTCHKLGCTKHG